MDIRIRTSFLEHPKSVKLRRRLHAEGVLALLRLWTFTAEHHPKGRLEGMTAEDIEIAAGWTGESGELVRVLTDLKWLDFEPCEDHAHCEMHDACVTHARRMHDASKCECVYQVHDWITHQPFVSTSDLRSEIGRKAAKSRWKGRRKGVQAKEKEESCSTHAPRMPDACPTHAEGNAPIPFPIPFPAPTGRERNTDTATGPAVEGGPVTGKATAPAKSRAAPKTNPMAAPVDPGRAKREAQAREFLKQLRGFYAEPFPRLWDVDKAQHVAIYEYLVRRDLPREFETLNLEAGRT